MVPVWLQLMSVGVSAGVLLTAVTMPVAWWLAKRSVEKERKNNANRQL